MPSGAQRFAELVLYDLRESAPHAEALGIRARGKTAVIGVHDAGEWVPLLRVSNPSASFNVMSLDARHHATWSPTGTRGVPAVIAEALNGPFRFLWEMEVNAAGTWPRTYDQEH